MSIHETKERKSGMVRVRGGFSDTNGFSICNKIMQTNELDDPTRIQLNNALNNVVNMFFENYHTLFDYRFSNNDVVQSLCKAMLNDVFCVSTVASRNTLFSWRSVYSEYIEKVLLNAIYNEVFDLIEYIARWFETKTKEEYQGIVYGVFNDVFLQEYVGYRFVDGRIVAITDEHEIIAIESACQIPFEGCRKHIEKAVGFLADRENKDYKNCIKESISAVESVCQIILNNNKTTLSDALKQLEKKGTQIHPALNHAFLKLYAYSCDQGGIRHAEGLTESDVSFEEAKFMLVSCCAFTNYLIAEYGKKSD